MPVILTFKEWRLLFYSNEGSPREPAHIHAIGHGKQAKFWLEPVSLANYSRCNRRELRELSELYWRPGMTISATKVYFDEDTLWCDLDDARTIGVPIAWFPRLLNATPEQRLAFELSPGGIHWWDLNEDISIEGLLAGRGDSTHPRKHAA